MIENFSKEELNNEQWKAIDGYDGLYEVSSLGRVRSKHSGEWKMLSQRIMKNGYLNVALYKDGREKYFYVHRLVASAFIPNDDETKIYINHRDECKQNNRLWNLEWCSAQYNSTYNNIHLRHKAYIHTQPKRDKVKDLYNPNLTYEQNLEIFRANGIECSEKTVRNLRKDLGLTNNKRDKLKELYNPDLSIQKNIELFKANGIDCSRETVIRLRKDLGLSKPRKTKQIS